MNSKLQVRLGLNYDIYHKPFLIILDSMGFYVILVLNIKITQPL